MLSLPLLIKKIIQNKIEYLGPLWFFILIILLCYPSQSFAIEYKSWNNGLDKEIPVKDMRMFSLDKFRIFYFTQGPNIIDKTDKDQNNIPDYVEDVSKQFFASNHVFNLLGFPSPLNTPYYNNAKYIDIYILSRDHLKGTLGMAFTAPEQAPLERKNVMSLKIFVAKGLNFNNSSTIPHEYFHLIQNGFSKIKNKWYFEGLARWAENILSKKKYYIDPNWDYHKILNSKNVLQHIQTMSYKSGQYFWIPLAIKFSKSQHILLPKDDILHELRYSNGNKVLQDTTFPGSELFSYFLLTLNYMDSKVQEKFDFKTWNSEQVSHRRNNSYIIEALKIAMDTYLNESTDMKK